MRLKKLKPQSGFSFMFYDVILGSLAVAFPLIGCGLFALFWKLLRDDRSPDPIYRSDYGSN
jgi:hypothetical protein